MAQPTRTPIESTLTLPSTRGLASLPDGELQVRAQQFAAVRRQVDAGTARVAAEIARRSTAELGHAGLAQREGARSAERLVERLAGVSAPEARALVRVGELLDDDAGHLAPVTAAVSAGELSVLAADAIRSGLGEPSPALDAQTLADAASLLVAVAQQSPVRAVGAQARALRDSLDADGVADREAALRDRRFLRLTLQPDGMTRLAGLLDPESAAVVSDAFDLVTAPRRGGPRFVDPVAAERAKAVLDDPRTTEQLTADAFVELIRIAGAADPGRVYTQRRPAVVVHVERGDLERGVGAAHLEGQSAAVSIATAERLACSAGAIPVMFDGSRTLELGRSQRRFTEAQRIALAARDGGCLWPGCDRPPSWCEAHHIDEWVRDHGRTDVDRGVLLCRFHHLMVHNQGWRIRRRASGFVAEPPPTRGGPPMPLPSRHPLRAAR